MYSYVATSGQTLQSLRAALFVSANASRHIYCRAVTLCLHSVAAASQCIYLLGSPRPLTQFICSEIVGCQTDVSPRHSFSPSNTGAKGYDKNNPSCYLYGSQIRAALVVVTPFVEVCLVCVRVL